MPAAAPLASLARCAAQSKSEIVPTAELPAFQARLLGWFAEAKRDLDWRRTRDPYRVWISEIMLQQTQVSTVIPYYARFLDRFPDVNALAAAPLDDVIAQSRACNDAAAALGWSGATPFLTMSFLALSVIPALKITDRGLVDVERFDCIKDKDCAPMRGSVLSVR